MRLPPLECIKGTARMFESCLVSFSGGKDSIATLDLCCKYFKEVKGVFYYQVPNLEFQEKTLRGYEAKYGIEIYRLPDPFALSLLLRHGWCRPKTDLSAECPAIQRKDCEDYLHKVKGWTAYGSRAMDSFVRRGYIFGRNRRCVEIKQRSFYPVGAWTNKQVAAYIKHNHLHLPSDYRLALSVSTEAGSSSRTAVEHSFGTMVAEHLIPLKEKFPEDFDRIKFYFPFVETEIVRHNLVKKYVETKQVPEVRDQESKEVETKERSLQPS